jgi:hypothetical protein
LILGDLLQACLAGMALRNSCLNSSQSLVFDRNRWKTEIWISFTSQVFRCHVQRYDCCHVVRKGEGIVFCCLGNLGRK